MATISDGPFTGDPASYSDSEWKAACVLDKGAKHPAAKDRYAIPVREPDGALNSHGLRKAAEQLAAANPRKRIFKAQRRLAKRYDEAGLPVRTEKATVSTADRNDMPDSAFAYIEPGGTKDKTGKTVPRSKRHFLIHDAAHVRDALARIAQGAQFGQQALPKVKAAAAKFGINVSKTETPVEYAVPVWKDDAKQIVYGVVLEPDLADSQGDTVTAEEIEKAAHAYLVESRKSDVQHNEVAVVNGEPIAQVVESYIAPEDMTVAGHPVRKGAWVMGMHVNDPGTWQQVRKGELTGFSIGGTGERVPLAA